MLRRLSILVRKPSQSRQEFARAWEFHGTLVKQLPGIRAYQQNHVLEEWDAGQPPPFRIDGIVELQFDSMDAMSAAFASAAATPVKADEPNFLGHGTGYVGAAPRTPVAADNGCKLIVVARNPNDGSAGDVIERMLQRMPQLTRVIRDDLAAVIARPEMVEGPQQADVFLHAYFATADAAQTAARAIAQDRLHAPCSVVRVRTLTVV